MTSPETCAGTQRVRMSIIVLQVVVGLGLAASALLLFAYSVKHGDSQQSDRLSLLPMEHDKPMARPMNESPPGAHERTQETHTA